MRQLSRGKTSVFVRFFFKGTDLPQRMKLILKIFVVQLLGSFVIAAGFGLVFNTSAALSAWLGAMSVALPHSLFAWYVFRFHGSTKQQLQLIVRSVYRGETIKLLSTALLVMAVLKHVEVTEWQYFIGFAIALLLQLILPILINNDNGTNDGSRC